METIDCPNCGTNTHPKWEQSTWCTPCVEATLDEQARLDQPHQDRQYI